MDDMGGFPREGSPVLQSSRTGTATIDGGTNTANNADSTLLKLDIDGTSVFDVRRDNKISIGGMLLSRHPTRTGLSIAATANRYHISNSYLNVGMNVSISWSSANEPTDQNWDLTLWRDAADTFAQRRATNAQTYRLYNTWTDASNYERLAFTWDSNVAKIKTEAAGTGTLRDLSIGSTSGKLGFLGATPVARAAHVADADTAHALNATFSDTEVESALNALATKINSILKTLEDFGLHATS